MVISCMQTLLGTCRHSFCAGHTACRLHPYGVATPHAPHASIAGAAKVPSDTMTSGISAQGCCAHSLAYVQLRGDIDKLKSALAHRTAQTQAAERAHTVSAAIFAMTNALTRGASLGPALDALRATAPEDEVVAAVVRSLPEATKGGSSSLGALLQRFAVKVIASRLNNNNICESNHPVGHWPHRSRTPRVYCRRH